MSINIYNLTTVVRAKIRSRNSVPIGSCRADKENVLLAWPECDFHNSHDVLNLKSVRARHIKQLLNEFYDAHIFFSSSIDDICRCRVECIGQK
jgi:hypothetical protein